MEAVLERNSRKGVWPNDQREAARNVGNFLTFYERASDEEKEEKQELEYLWREAGLAPLPR